MTICEQFPIAPARRGSPAPAPTPTAGPRDGQPDPRPEQKNRTPERLREAAPAFAFSLGSVAARGRAVALPAASYSGFSVLLTPTMPRSVTSKVVTLSPM
jgi:hypothetical protein